MTKGWKHINYTQRMMIRNCLNKKMKLNRIAEAMNLDPTSISKEIKRNRSVLSGDPYADNQCKNLLRYPYVCDGCTRKPITCKYPAKYTYQPAKANLKAHDNLVEPRRGIDCTSEEFRQIDDIVSNGVYNKESVYSIVQSHPELNKSVSTIYHYINSGLLRVRRFNLPMAVSYKKRKKGNKKYEYSENRKIDRSNRTYIDYLAFRRTHVNHYVSQLDFLGSIKSDSKSILTLTIPDLHFVLLDIIDKPSSRKVNGFFNDIEEKIGTDNFKEVFPCILTDRDPCFADIEGLEVSPFTGEVRTSVFYCDPYVSNQKGNVENMNRQLRKFFPKGKSIDHFSKDDVRKINSFILKTRVKSLSGASPQEAFIKVFGELIYEKMMK